MDVSGIYKILNIISEKCYIGSSYRINKRWKDHKRCLIENKHTNKFLQASWNLHGEQAFKFIIIEICTKDKLLEREQFWIDEADCVNPRGYNANPKAESRLGTRHTSETIAKLKAKVISDKHKEQIAIATRGRKASLETKEKIRKGNSGKKNTEQARENMRKAWVKRKEARQPVVTSPPIMIGEKLWT